MHVTTNSILLHVLVSDHTNTTFRIEVDGQQWAQTVKSVYNVSGLVSDKEYLLVVNVIQNGMFVSTMSQTVQTLQLGELIALCTHEHIHMHITDIGSLLL